MKKRSEREGSITDPSQGMGVSFSPSMGVYGREDGKGRLEEDGG